MRKIHSALIGLIILATMYCENAESTSIPKSFVTIASHYSDSLHGRRTASGELFNTNALTAAHKTLPFNTRLLVMNIKTGKKVVVRINDRGPYVAGRELDLSRAAFNRLSNKKGIGLLKVQAEVVYD